MFRDHLHFAALIALALLLGAGCSSVSTEAKADPQFNFAACRTWSWMPSPPDIPGRRADVLLKIQLEKVVEADLAAQGLQHVEEGGDLLVVLHGGARYETAATDPAQGYGYRYESYPWRYGIREPAVDLDSERALYLVFVSGNKRQPVWRGKGIAEVGDADHNRRMAEEAVRKLLAEFPPTRPAAM
jgi:hypothetical protein